ncbi:PucC family protein [Synechococcus sp. MU1643]|uniref:PucC family protein n=1 Tax=Synechococcus sp. MU1643 TaxID=2508349 RepID=UPI0021020947|nr:PucC family protein [Synechococcus sp. MU1643]
MAIALLFGVACQLVLRLANSMEAYGGELNGLLIGLLILVFVAIGTAIAAGGTAFSALIADRTTEAERPRVLSVLMPLVLLGLGVVSVFGVERRITGLTVPVGSEPPDVPQRLALHLPQLLLKLRTIPQAGRFLGFSACSPSACFSTMRCGSPMAPPSLA